MIAEILIKLEKDTQLRDRYVQLGRNHAKQFTWDACVERLINVLRKYS